MNHHPYAQESLVRESEALYHADYDFFITDESECRRYAVLPFNKHGRPMMFVSDSSKQDFMDVEGISEAEFQQMTARIL